MYLFFYFHQYLAAFKGYLVSQHDERVLLAYHECLETAERLTELSTVLDQEVRLAIFLHAANAFYDRLEFLQNLYR